MWLAAVGFGLKIEMFVLVVEVKSKYAQLN